MQRCAPLVGRHVLARLVRGGVGGIRGEMGQACFKALSMLFKSQVHVFGVSTSDEAEPGEEGAGAGVGGGGGGRRRKRGGNLFGLSSKQLRALLVVLQMAVVEMEHQNATFTLIKAVVSQQVMLPEVRLFLSRVFAKMRHSFPTVMLGGCWASLFVCPRFTYACPYPGQFL